MTASLTGCVDSELRCSGGGHGDAGGRGVNQPLEVAGTEQDLRQKRVAKNQVVVDIGDSREEGADKTQPLEESARLRQAHGKGEKGGSVAVVAGGCIGRKAGLLAGLMASSASTPGGGDGEAGAWAERENGGTAALGSRAIMASNDASPFVVFAAERAVENEEIGGGGMLYDRDDGEALYFPRDAGVVNAGDKPEL
nr:hypothetical protein Iba_chr12fCG2500 [Ipomoea batatas]